MSKEPDERTRDVIEAAAAGAEHARKLHEALGLPMVIWRDGKPQWVDAKTLQPVPPPDDRRTA